METLKQLLDEAMDLAMVEVFSLSLDEIINQSKHGDKYKTPRIIVAWMYARIYGDNKYAMNRLLKSKESIRKHVFEFKNRYSIDREFTRKCNEFLNETKNYLDMWNDKMSEEDRNRAIEAGLIKVDKPKKKVPRNGWKLVWEFGGQQQKICGPTSWPMCEYQKKQKSREPQYKKGTFRIIPN